MRDAFHRFIEERGVNENLFDFLQAWLYVKEHRGLMRWFKTVGTYINENRPAKNS
jgi:complement component 1 Q subcomponent-binding protein